MQYCTYITHMQGRGMPIANGQNIEHREKTKPGKVRAMNATACDPRALSRFVDKNSDLPEHLKTRLLLQQSALLEAYGPPPSAWWRSICPDFSHTFFYKCGIDPEHLLAFSEPFS
jgi:hypothetical protein